MRLKIQLPGSWKRQNKQDDPAIFCCQGSGSIFNVTWAEYLGREPLDVTKDKLKQNAARHGQENGYGEMSGSWSGECKFGIFGTATFRSTAHPWAQVWRISDGRNQIMAAYICDRWPEKSEVAEAQQIANSLTLGSEEPTKLKWKFW
jgi:hypothetical protein